METITSNTQIHKYTLIYSFLLLFLVVNSSTTFAQQYSTRSKKAIQLYQEADKFRVRRQLPQAIQLLEQAVLKDKKFAEAHYMLGICYARVGNVVKAIASFNTSYNYFDPNKVPNDLYSELAYLYFMIDKFPEATSMCEKYILVERRNMPKVAMVNKLKNDIDYIKSYSGETYQINPEYLTGGLNKFPMQYFPALTADQKTIFFTKRELNDNEDIFLSTRESANDDWEEPVSVSRVINTSENEGTCSISADGRTMVFTSCSEDRGYGRCDLFSSRKIGEKWTVPQNLGPIVNTVYWESQPSLSADGRTLYFVSDRKGSYGGKDIWKTTLNSEDKWTSPVNLGKSINTYYDEVSPYIHSNDQDLFFSSNGHPGFGGYDLYYTTKNRTGWKEPKNMGPPLNTKEDQLSLIITADGKKGYYSLESLGFSSKLVVFDMPELLQPVKKSNYIYGTVTDYTTKKPLKANIELFSIASQKRIFSVNSDSITGEYLMVLAETDSFALYAAKDEYLFHRVEFEYDSGGKVEPIRMDIQLKRPEKGNSIVLKNTF
ncbi:MAG: hypothetical protein OEW75_07490, partial [Cyclobacteriaceae bacterium]|nr:hypothetical protein [Cyclobacteriaceae bacterium]